MDYQYAFNGTGTRVVIVQQPCINIGCTKLEQYFKYSLSNYLQSKLGMDEKCLKLNKINIYIIAKD